MAAKKKSKKAPTKADRVASLWEKSKPASQVTSAHKIKALITGPSGSGKSSLAARTGRVLYVPTELQGIPVVQDNNPDAIIWHNYDGRPGVRSYSDLVQLRAMLRDPSLPDRVDWVCIDGLTDLQTLLRAHYTSKQGKRRDVTDMDSWGITLDMTARLAREFRAKGDERAREIRAEADKEARILVAKANETAERTRGEGEAKAAKIYADAYTADPEFYEFTRSLEAYRKTLGEGDTLVLPPDHGFFGPFQAGGNGGKR